MALKSQKRGRGSSAGLSAVGRSVAVLEHLAGCAAGAPVSEISRALNIEISVVSRLLATLEDARCVRRSPEAADRYVLSWRVPALAYRFVDALDIPKAFLPELESLAGQVRELVQLAVVEQDCVRIIAKADVDQRITLRGLVGRIAHPDSMATGRAWLAFLSDADQRRALAHGRGDVPVRSHPPSRALQRELAEIRAQGYALETAANTEDVVAVAVPIRLAQQVVGVISISGPAYRLPAQRLRAMVPSLQTTAARVSALWPAILLRNHVRPLVEEDSVIEMPLRRRKA